MTTQDTRQAASADLTTHGDPPTPDQAPRPLLLPLLIVLVALGGGWGVWQAVGSRVASAVAGHAAGPAAPPIEARTVDGGHFSLAAQHGRVVVVYSMAAWCIACLPEAIALGEVARTARVRGRDAAGGRKPSE